MTDLWKDFEKALEQLELDKGGPGSGHHGHKGRPGQVGGGQAGDGVEAAPPPVLENGLPKRKAQTSRIVDMQRGASDESQRKTSDLGGGIGNSYKSDIKDDGRVCYKPDAQNGYRYAYDANYNAKLQPLGSKRGQEIRPGQLDEKIPMSAREEAVHKLDRATGMNVTPDMIVGDFGKGRGSALAWVDGKFDIDRPDFKNADLKKIATLDYLIANTDRHGGNMIRGTDGRLWAMDNSLSLPYKTYPRGFRSVPLKILSLQTEDKIPGEIKQAVARLDEKKVRGIMKKFGPAEIRGVLKRRDDILNSKTWYDLRDKMNAGRNDF